MVCPIANLDVAAKRKIPSLHIWMKLFRTIGVDFDITHQLIIYSAFMRYWRKMGSTVRQYVSYL
jgi:hypothetical protein